MENLSDYMSVQTVEGQTQIRLKNARYFTVTQVSTEDLREVFGEDDAVSVPVEQDGVFLWLNCRASDLEHHID